MDPAMAGLADDLVDDNGDEIRRLFDPEVEPMYYKVPEDQLVVFDEQRCISQLQLLHPRTQQIEPDRNTLVVYVDGACRGNGTPSAKASWAVYLGPASPHNTQGLLAPELPQTSSRAEIEALAQALDIVHNKICKDDFSLTQVKIVSDSEYLVNSMALWIEEWIDNEGHDSNGQPVAHFDRLRELHEKLDYMEYSDDGGICVEFWHVPRERNQGADDLANRAFGEAA